VMEVRSLGAATQRHHQHDTVHDVHLLQNSKEANPRIISAPLGLFPLWQGWSESAGGTSLGFCKGCGGW
jgi:hypothetical protein